MNAFSSISLTSFTNEYLKSLLKSTGSLANSELVFLLVWCRTSANISWVINKRKCSTSVFALDAAFFKPTRPLIMLCLETRPTFRTFCGLFVKWIYSVLFLSFITPMIIFSVFGISNVSQFCKSRFESMSWTKRDFVNILRIFRSTFSFSSPYVTSPSSSSFSVSLSLFTCSPWSEIRNCYRCRQTKKTKESTILGNNSHR